MENDGRFAGTLGHEYELFKLACPHYDDMQQHIGMILSGTFGRRADVGPLPVLELGCGTGYTTKIILDTDTRITVVALDNEQVMLEQAKDNLAGYVKQRRLTFIQSDALDYLKSVRDDSFAGFASACTLHNFESGYRNEVNAEIYRALRHRGGLYVNGDKYAEPGKQLENLDWQLNQFQKVYGRMGREDLLKFWTQHYLEDERLSHVQREREAMNELQDIGFRFPAVSFREKMEAVMSAIKD